MDWSCQDARYNILYDYMVEYIEAALQDVDIPANAHESEVVALSFLLWAVAVELDSETAAGTAVALWVINVVSVLEEQS